MFESLLGLDPVDYARYGALIVFFLLGGLSPEKTWLRADVAMSIGMGVGWLVFPQVLLGFQVDGSLNKVHLLHSRSLGIHLILYALPIIFNKRTRDDKVYTGLYLSRFLATAAMLSAIIYSHSKPSGGDLKLTNQHFWFNILAAGGWLFALGYQMMKSGGAPNYSSRLPENALKYHLFCDIFLFFQTAMFMLSHGEMAFTDLNIAVDPNDAFLLFSSRVHAVFALGDCFYVLAAHTFDDREAIKNHFKFRILQVAVYTCLQLAHGLLRTPTLISLFITYGALTANSILAIRFINNK